MSKSALNITLQRPILNGDIYNALFSFSKCTPTFLGNGDTEFTINKMKEWVLKTQKQLDTKKVQQLFGKPSQQATITNVHSFLFNHFQYNADGYNQNLRSPNCAWQERHQGIDCKSYSIIASILLLKNNIVHYIRRITQPHFNPTQYTHVYVIVPFDQVNADLSKGYYTIDGTLPTMHEPAHIKTDDILMNKMPHYALNGTGITDGTNDEVEVVVLDENGNEIITEDSDWLGDTWGSVEEWFSGVDMGGFLDGIFGGGSGSPCVYNLAHAEQETEDLKRMIANEVGTLATANSLPESSEILTELYYKIANFAFYRKWSLGLVDCAAALAAQYGDSIANQELPMWFDQINAKLQTRGLSLQLTPTTRKTESLNTGTYHDAIYPGTYDLKTMQVTVVPLSSGGITTTTTTASNTPTGQQDNDPPKKSSNTGKIVVGVLVLTALGLGVKAYMDKQKNDKTTPNNKTK